MRLLEIPNFCDLAMESQDPYNRDRDQWPLFRTEGADALLRKVNGFIEYVSKRGARPVLCFYFHPWEFHKMPQGSIDYGEASVTPLPFITRNCGEEACRQFERLCIALQERGARFLTCQQLAEKY
jgi:hypothetical protein